MRRRGLNKIWTLALALLIAMGAMGVAYSTWTDEIYIEGSLYTGDINASVTCNGPCSPDGNYITCASVPNEPMKLTFTVNNAVAGTQYSCNFLINNLNVDADIDFESLPIKIDSVTLSPDTYPGITGSVIGLPADPQIDPGHSAGGTVLISVASGTTITPPLNLVYTLEVTVVRWNK
jgi:hypothetical protein